MFLPIAAVSAASARQRLAQSSELRRADVVPQIATTHEHNGRPAMSVIRFVHFKEHMKSATLWILLCACILICGSSQPLDGKTQDAVKRTGTAAGSAGKMLIPHKSWPCGMAEGIPAPERGTLVFEANLKLDQAYDLGRTPYGQRKVFVFQEGGISGEKINGSVMPGGLDFQLSFSGGGMEIEEIFVLRTGDGKYIFMRSAGTAADPNDVRMVPDFEAPNASGYSWLNTGKYAGRRVVDLAARTMKISVYDVSAVTMAPDAANSIRMSKPEDVQSQSWDYRKASAEEKRGDQLIVENVTLAASQSVGASKRGNRNIIPITGGTLSGKITGKVLFGGADYQNLANPATIDARYLWQTDDGEVIIVRNGGSFGLLAPTFEARVDGKYAWLNKGVYLSSNPGMGSGGVKLTFYESRQ